MAPPQGDSRLSLMLNRLPFINDWFDENALELIGGATTAFTLKLVGAALGFAFNWFLARTLGPDGAGIYFLALTVVTIASVVGRVGLDNVVIRFTASNFAVGDFGAVREVFRKSMWIALLGSLLVTILMYSGATWMSEHLFSKPELATPLRWMSLAIIPTAVLFLQGEILKGLKRIRDSQLVNGVLVPALSLVGLIVLGPRFGVDGVALAYALASLLTVFAGYYFWRHTMSRYPGKDGDISTRELLHSSMPLFWVSIMNLVINWASTFALGIWGTSADVGIFGIATRTANFVTFFIVAVQTIAAPKFAELYRRGEMAALDTTARNATLLMAIAASPLLILLVFWPGFVMGIFGAEFTEGAASLAILAFGQFFVIATGSVGILLMMSGHEREVRNVLIGSAVLNILFCVTLIPSFGALGAALAVTLTLAIKNLVLLLFVHNVLHVRPSIFTLSFRRKHRSSRAGD